MLNVRVVIKDTSMLMALLRFVLHAMGTILKRVCHVAGTIGRFVLCAMG